MDYSEYRKHPRILEIRFSLMHSNFVMNYGLERTAEIFQKLCELGLSNWSVISSLIGQKGTILNANITDRKRYRQEVMFMGLVYNEPQHMTMSNYLRISKRLLYESYDGELIPKKFLNDEWLEKLDYSTTVAGIPAYALELERFINFLTSIAEVVTGVPMAKV